MAQDTGLSSFLSQASLVLASCNIVLSGARDVFEIIEDRRSTLLVYRRHRYLCWQAEYCRKIIKLTAAIVPIGVLALLALSAMVRFYPEQIISARDIDILAKLYGIGIVFLMAIVLKLTISARGSDLP